MVIVLFAIFVSPFAVAVTIPTDAEVWVYVTADTNLVD